MFLQIVQKKKKSFQSHPFFKSVDFSDGDGEETVGGLAVV